MSIDDLSKKPLWLRDGIMDAERVHQLQYAMPMPKFGTIKANEYVKLDPNHPTRLVRDVMERFPLQMSMPTEHPAFKVILANMANNPYANLGPLDWLWHKEALRQAVMKEEMRRVFNRVEIERHMQELHEARHIRGELDKRAFFFAEAIKNRLEQTLNIERAAERAISCQAKTAEHHVALLDESKRTAFVLLYLRHFAPSKERIKRKTKELLTTDNLSQIKAAEHFTLNAFELLVAHVQRMYPVLRKDEIERLFARWRQQINSVRIGVNEAAAFKQAITKMFAQAFLYDSANGVIAQREQQERLYDQQVSRQFQQAKHLASRGLNKELQDGHLRYLDDRRADFAALVDKLNYQRLVTDIYNERELEFRQHRADLEQLVPVVHHGMTDWVERNPVTYRTQMSLIRQWVNNVMMMINQTHTRNAELTEAANENFKNYADQLNAQTLTSAVDVHRMMDARRMRDLMEQYTLEQLVRMFAATSSAAAMVTGYHVNTATEPTRPQATTPIVNEILAPISGQKVSYL